MDSLLKYGMIGMMGISAVSMLSNLFGGSSNSSDNANTAAQSGTCTTRFYYTSDVNALSDPCAQYNPSAGTGNTAGTTPTSDSGIADLLRNLGNNNPIGGSNTTPLGSSPLSDILNSQNPGQNPSSGNCPAVQLNPNCGMGMVPRDNGLDRNGCQLPTTCVTDLSNTFNPMISSTSRNIASIDTSFPPVNPINSSITSTNPIDQVQQSTAFPTSNPLATAYVPPTTNTIDLGNAVNPNNATNTPYTSAPVPVPITQALTSTIYYNDTTSSATPPPSRTPLNQPLSQQLPANGLHGDIRSFGKGVTIYATSRNANTVVAGFYGSGSTAGRLCQSRPWAKNFLSYVIPAAFFDNICSWAGYPNGAVSGSVQGGGGTGTFGGTVRNTSVGAPTPVGGTQYPPGQQPQAKIWARPASVSIGGRTTIFWTSQFVTACTESSSDGNFSGSTVSGGASTVALSGPVTFTIKCRSIDGATISNSTTVTIGI